MKRIISVAVLLFIILSASAQSSIDKLFNKYQGKDGFVTVTISGNFLKMVGAFDDEHGDDDIMKHVDKFSSIRILSQEDENEDVGNFYDMIMDEVSKGDYEEMMTINSSDSDVKILVRSEGKVFKEFLLVAGGDDNAIIQIKGSMSYEDIKEMSESIDGDHSFHSFDIR